MKLSARNILKGTVVGLTTGAVTTHVRIEIASGSVITSAITNEAATELGLKVGDTAYAVIKSSDVIVAVE